jgi:RNA polymerase primary sigma factor
MVTPSSNDPDDRVRELLRLGERRGYLTYQEINDKLPDEMITPAKLDAFLDEIDTRGIRLIDEDQMQAPGSV